MVFKSELTQAHGRRSTFVAGFGCKLSEAVEASCSAYPFFDRKIITTANGDMVELIDGGYIANNPSLFALADATSALGYDTKDCRVLSIGCGQYPDPAYSIMERMKRKFWLTQLLRKTLDFNANSMDQLRQLLFQDVPTVRISETFSKQEMATDMFEHEPHKLSLLFQAGRNSFGHSEVDFRQTFLTEV